MLTINVISSCLIYRRMAVGAIWLVIPSMEVSRFWLILLLLSLYNFSVSRFFEENLFNFNASIITIASFALINVFQFR